MSKREKKEAQAVEAVETETPATEPAEEANETEQSVSIASEEANEPTTENLENDPENDVPGGGTSDNVLESLTDWDGGVSNEDLAKGIKAGIKADFLAGIDRMDIHHDCKEAVRALVESVTR